NSTPLERSCRRLSVLAVAPGGGTQPRRAGAHAQRALKARQPVTDGHPQDGPAGRFDRLLPTPVVSRAVGVAVAVHLDDDSLRPAREINDELLDGSLPHKLEPGQAPAAEHLPEFLFGDRHLCTKLSGVRQLA